MADPTEQTHQHASVDPPQRVVVLFGGQSAEHDVSCVSAAHVLAAIDRDRYDVEAVGISRDGSWHPTVVPEISGKAPAALTADGAQTEPSTLLAQHNGGCRASVVLPVLHGPMGEDGTVQGMLELAGLPYVGTGVLGSALCMDKSAAKEMAAQHGIAQCRWRVLLGSAVDDAALEDVVSDLGLPLFVKPANMGSSVGVSRAATLSELRSAVELALSFDECVVVEEAITGREIEVAVLGNRGNLRASTPGEIVPGDDFYSYDDKYHDGVAQTLVPADLDDEAAAEVRALAVTAAEALRVEGLARVDFFYEADGRGFLLNEINTMPGFTPISMYPKLWKASGLNYPALIDELIALALARHRRRFRPRPNP